MPYQTFPVEEFKGLDTNDRGGALDIVNVRVDDPTRLRVRGGTELLQDDPTTVGTDFRGLHYTPVNSPKVYTHIHNSGLRAFTSAGAFTDAAKTNLSGSAVAFNDRLVMARSTVGLSTWNGTTMADIANTPICKFVTTMPSESRLVAAYGSRFGLSGEVVSWSDPGSHTSWPTTNYLTLQPQDSTTDDISALVTWRDLVFIFKGKKFFVATGTGVTASGSSELVYNAVDVGIGCAVVHGAVAAEDGVYFIGADGVYHTTGGVPERVSGALQRWWDGEDGDFFSVPANTRQMFSIGADSQNIYLLNRNLPSGESRVFVYALTTNEWTVYNFPNINGRLSAMAVIGLREFVFVDSVGRLFRAADDLTNGDASFLVDELPIASRYQFAFTDFGDEGEKALREVQLEGSSYNAETTVDMWIATDRDTAEGTPTTTTGWGTDPEAALVRFRKAHRGRRFSLCIDEDAAQWDLRRLIFKLRDARPPR